MFVVNLIHSIFTTKEGVHHEKTVGLFMCLDCGGFCNP